MNSNKKSSLNNIFSNSNVSISEAKKAIESGDSSKLIDNLSNEDKQKLNNILNDKNALEKLLSSPDAQALMKIFNKKK